MFRLIAVALFALPFSASAYVVFESVEGEVTAGERSKAVRQDQRLFTRGVPIVTGPGARAMLRFDDGLRILLHENSELRIWDYVHTPANMRYNRVVLDLMRGSARFVMGYIALNNPQTGFQLRTPQAYLQAKGGADFSAAIVNPLYLSVSAGAVLATNNYGAVSFPTGSTASIASNAAMPLVVSPAALPPQAAAAFGSMSAVAMAYPAGGAASGAAFAGLGGAAQEVTRWVILGGLIAAVVVGIAASQDDDPTPTTTHH
jgi:hypothetical protein